MFDVQKWRAESGCRDVLALVGGWHFKIIFFCKMKIHLNPLLQLIPVNGMQWQSNFRILFIYLFYATASTKKRKWSIKLGQYFSFKGLMINLSQIIQIRSKKKSRWIAGTRTPSRLLRVYLFSQSFYICSLQKISCLREKKRLDIFNFLSPFH